MCNSSSGHEMSMVFEAVNQITLATVFHISFLLLLSQCTNHGLKFFALLLALSPLSSQTLSHLSLGSNLAIPLPCLTS